MKYNGIVFILGIPAIEYLSDSAFSELFDDIAYQEPIDGIRERTRSSGEKTPMIPAIGKAGSKYLLLVPTSPGVTTDGPGSTIQRVTDYSADTDLAIGFGWAGSNDARYEHGCAILPYRAYNSDAITCLLGEEFRTGCSDPVMQSSLYTACCKQGLKAFFVPKTLSIGLEETDTAPREEALVRKYMGKDMETAWLLSYMSGNRKKAGSVLIISDTQEDTPFDENGVFSLPEGKEQMIKDCTIKGLKASIKTLLSY